MKKFQKFIAVILVALFTSTFFIACTETPDNYEDQAELYGIDKKEVDDTKSGSEQEEPEDE